MPQNSPIHVVFTDGLPRTLLHHIGSAGRHERGGVLLGRRANGKTVVSSVVFPPQIGSGPDHCIFEVRSIEAIRAAIRTCKVRQQKALGTIVGWVHSHPRLGLFLSATDVATFANWRQLDAQAVAVVLDPFLPGVDTDRIAYWRDIDERVGTPVTGVASLGDALRVADGADLADAITRAAVPGGGWEIVTAHNVICVFPYRPAAEPDPSPQMNGARSPAALDPPIQIEPAKDSTSESPLPENPALDGEVGVRPTAGESAVDNPLAPAQAADPLPGAAR